MAEQTTVAYNPAVWFEIYVQDMKRAQTFYETVLAVRLQPLPSDLQMMAFPSDPKVAGAGGALIKMEGVNSGGNSTIIYFHSQDCAIEAGRVVAAGGRIHKEKMSIGPYGFIALAYDTEGNMFGVHSMK